MFNTCQTGHRNTDLSCTKGRFRLDISSDFFLRVKERVVRYWNGLPREAGGGITTPGGVSGLCSFQMSALCFGLVLLILKSGRQLPWRNRGCCQCKPACLSLKPPRLAQGVVTRIPWRNLICLRSPRMECLSKKDQNDGSFRVSISLFLLFHSPLRFNLFFFN